VVNAAASGVSLSVRRSRRAWFLPILCLFRHDPAKLGARSDAELFIDSHEIRLDRLAADHYLCRNFFVRPAGRREV